MSEGQPSSGSGSRTWLERLSQRILGEEPPDREQLVEHLREAEQKDLLDAEALSMMEGVLQVSDMQVRDIMVPRSQMVVIDSEQAPEAFVSTIIDSGHSRFPVIGDTRDEVEGILLAKDLLQYFARGNKRRPFDIRDVMRPAVFIPESKRLNVLLREFRSSRNHMAIVADEYGGVGGLVTIEDVLEQIVGEIDDEHDTEEDAYVKSLGDGEYTVKALTPIEDFNEQFGTRFSDQEFDTIGGLVVKAFGHLPERGETQTVGDVRFTVVRADNRRIHLLRMLLPQGSEGGRDTARRASAGR
jgi:magnesium and cobalt transporter